MRCSCEYQYCCEEEEEEEALLGDVDDDDDVLGGCSCHRKILGGDHGDDLGTKELGHKDDLGDGDHP